MELPRLFRELAVRPNWATGQEWPWSGRWPRTQWPLCRVPWLRWENLPEGQKSLQHFTNIGFMGSGQTEATPEKQHMTARLGFAFAKTHVWRTLRAWSKAFCDLMRLKLNSLAWMQSASSGGNRAQLIAYLIPSLLWSMVVMLWGHGGYTVKLPHAMGKQHYAMGMLFSSRNWETCKDRWNNEWSQIQENHWGEPASECKRPWPVAKIYVPTGQWPQEYRQSNTGMASEKRTWKSFSGPAEAQTWIPLRVREKTWTLLFTDAAHTTWQSFSKCARKNGRKSPNPDVLSWYRHVQEDLKP